MKKVTKKIITISSFLLLLSVNSFAQNTATDTSKDGLKKSTKLVITKVPKKVTETFYKEYPLVTYGDWYGYPTFNDLDWYDYDPFLYTNNYPENYVIEFTKDYIPYRSIYSKTGEKIATHKLISAALPIEVITSINKTKYKDWVLEKDKEEIFKDSDSDKMKVYKVTVENGQEKHTLYFRSDGTLLKDKNCFKH